MQTIGKNVSNALFHVLLATPESSRRGRIGMRLQMDPGILSHRIAKLTLGKMIIGTVHQLYDGESVRH